MKDQEKEACAVKKNILKAGKKNERMPAAKPVFIPVILSELIFRRNYKSLLSAFILRIKKSKKNKYSAGEKVFLGARIFFEPRIYDVKNL